jgi:DNA-binding NtrC family response regulator
MVIMMTVYAGNDLIQEALQKGVIRCFFSRKPFKLLEMLDFVKKLSEK